jgi:hypothetical protein
MTNREMIQLNSVLDQVSHIRGKKFAYAVFKNKNIIAEEMKIFDKLKREPHPDYPEYEVKRKALCIEHSNKNDDGTHIEIEGRYDIIDVKAFEEDFTTLKEKYKDAIQHLTEATHDFEEFMKTEAKVELVKVSLEDFINDLPDDIDAKLLMALKYMIDD